MSHSSCQVVISALDFGMATDFLVGFLSCFLLWGKGLFTGECVSLWGWSSFDSQVFSRGSDWIVGYVSILVVELVSAGRGLYSSSQWLCLLTTLQIGCPSFPKIPFSPSQKKRLDMAMS